MTEQEMQNFTRPITAEAIGQLECAINDTEELASVLFVMQQAFCDGGEPDADITAKALNSVGGSLMRISKNLDHVVDMIYQRNQEKGNI